MAAAAASCSSDLAGTTTAPQSNANSITVAQTSGSTLSSTDSTHGASVNNSGSPAAQPECAVPAIGCPPTKLVASPADFTNSRTATLTLVTSVSGQCGARSRTRSSTIGRAGTGTATTISAPASAARFSAVSMLAVASNPSAMAACTPSTDRL